MCFPDMRVVYPTVLTADVSFFANDLTLNQLFNLLKLLILLGYFLLYWASSDGGVSCALG